jgi:hypothetical protein
VSARELESLLRSLGGDYFSAALLKDGCTVQLRVVGHDGSRAYACGEGDSLDSAISDLVRKMGRAA